MNWSLSKLWKLFWPRSSVRVQLKPPTPPRRPQTCPLRLEPLEDRIAPATFTWDGGGADDNINTAANWVGDINPSFAGTDDVVFSGAVRPNPVVNVAATFQRLTFSSATSFNLTAGAGSITLNGALGGTSISVTSGSHTIGEDITLTTTGQTFSNTGTGLTISSGVNNGGFELTVDGSGNTTASNVISGAGGLTKSGTGTLTLSGAADNTYTGTTTVTAGTLQLNKLPGFGFVAIAGNLVIGDAVGIDDSDVVRLMANDQIADTATVTIARTGLLDLNGFSDTIGPLIMFSGTGANADVTTGAGVLTLGGDVTLNVDGGGATGGEMIGGNLSLGGATRTVTVNDGSDVIDLYISFAISGSGGLTKAGPGTLVLDGTNTYTGATTVNAGILRVGGSIAASSGVTVNTGGTLEGAGTVSAITSVGGTVAPGTNFPGPGILSSGNVTLDAASTFTVQLNGTTAGTGYDQLNVAGTVNLGSATLSRSLGFASSVSDAFTILNNDGADAVVGTFAGLGEGAIFELGASTFKISYVGGSGNDVVLTNLGNSVNVSISGVAMLEGDSGSTNMIFTVTRSGNLAPAFTVDFATQNGTATAGIDYTATSGTLTFLSGETTKTIAVPILGDVVLEPNEALTVVLSNPVQQAEFAAAVNFGAGTNPHSVTTADFNGDGRRDLAIANFSSNNVSVLLNTTAAGATTPSFAAAVNFGVGINPNSVTAADINGDGRPDLAVTNFSSNNVSVLLNTTAAGAATPSFAAAVNFAAGTNPRSVLSVDFNGDGRTDLALANEGSNDASVLLNTTAAGAATPTFAAAVNFAAGTTPTSVTAADINGDGRPDLAVSNAASDNVSVLLNTTAAGAATPTFAAAVNFAVGTGSRIVTAADFNGDGRPDLAVANRTSSNVSVLLNTTAAGAATPTFAAAVNFGAGSDPQSVTAADVNGDGRPDLAVANIFSANVSVLLNTTAAGAATPTFAAAVNFAAGTNPFSVTAADVNGDGRTDLAVANYGSNTVSVLLNTTAPIVVAPAVSSAANFGAGTGASEVTAADINGDGRTDLAVANRLSNNVSVLLNTTAAGAATPTFAAAVNFAAGTASMSVTAVDVNGDGRPDLAVANKTSNDVSVLLNTTAAGAATPTFAAAVNFAAGTLPFFVTAVDFNGDGRPDLAVVNDGSNDVSVLLNTTAAGAATPTFAAAVNFGSGLDPFGATAADVNGDGRPDLTLANRTTSNVSVLLNTTPAGAATPTFAAAVNFAAGADPERVTAADVNGDGRPDLAVANFTSNNVSVLLNTTAAGAATPTFAAAVNFAAGTQSFSVTAADVNGDGRPDLAVANYGSANVSVLLNTTAAGAATPTFAAAVNFAAGTNPYGVTAADVNGDGRPDLAVANKGSANVSVLLNTTVKIPLGGSPATGTITNDDGPTFGFAFAAGAGLDDYARATAVDSAGNVYVLGHFQGTVDFDPGAGTVNLTSNGGLDIFVAKYSPSGSLVWARTMGGTLNDEGAGMFVDAAGNVYSTGFFRDTVDFDPGAGTFNLTSAGNADVFVSKLDSAGNFVWARALGGAAAGPDEGVDIFADGAGNVYTTGNFFGTADFDPGAGTFNLTSAGVQDIFVSKLDSSGNFVWAGRMGGAGIDTGYGIAVDGGGNVYTSGYFNSAPADFDPGAGTLNLSSAGDFDAFVSKLDSSGNFLWARSWGNTGADPGYTIALDGGGNVFTTGSFNGTVDFDPGAGTFNLTSAGSADIFVSKLDSAGNFVWARAMGGTADDSGDDITLDGAGNVYATGIFNGTADFDPGPGVFNLTSAGLRDIFVSKLDSTGNFLWAQGMGGTGSDEGRGIAVSGGNVFLAGFFQATPDFDPGPGTFNLTSAGGNDIFVSKLVQASIGDRVWHDLNADGDQDAGEPGIAGAVAELFDVGADLTVGTGDDVSLGTRITNSAGNYVFDNPPSSANGYYITFRAPVGFSFTAQDAGGDDTKDSDANPTTGRTAAFTAVDSTRDAGLTGAGPAFGFALNAGYAGPGFEEAHAIATDAAGNVYVTGQYQDTVDFDPGPGTYNLFGPEERVFVAKYTSAGALVWARGVGALPGDSLGTDITVDAAGNVYATGRFGGTVDFDPGAGVFNLTSSGTEDPFVWKLDRDGNFVWAKSLTGPDNNDSGAGIAVDGSGNVYVTGTFKLTVDFDPGAGVFNLTSNGGADAFLVKLNSGGNLIWARSYGAASDDDHRGLAVDGSGNVYSVGSFQGTVDFDPSGGVFNLTSAGGLDVSIWKLDSGGNFVWARQVGAGSNEFGSGLALDGAANVHVSGYFSGTVDFDPGAGSFNLSSAGGDDAFVLKLDSGGTFIWARSYGGAGNENAALTLDGSGNVYTAGDFQGTADFDPGTGVFNLTSAGGDDAYIAKLDSAGNFVFARSWGGASTDNAVRIAVHSSGAMYTSGRFQGTSDFDPGTGTFNLTASGAWDLSVSRINQPVFGDVWRDLNGNGIQDAGEPGIAGAVAELFDVGADLTIGTGDDASLGTRITSAAGSYSFDKPPSTANGYYITFRAPVGFSFTTQDVGSDDSRDSDANPISGRTGVFTILNGSRDAGLTGAEPGFGFALGAGSALGDWGEEITTDNAGNVYVIGAFQGTVDFDPGPGTVNLTSAGAEDIFVTKYSSSGALVWARAMGGASSDGGNDIALDGAGNIYVAGLFNGTADFDPGAGVFNLTSAGSQDIFVAKLDGGGNFVWARAVGSTGTDLSQVFAVDSSGNSFTTGRFNGTVDFDPGAGVFNLSSAGNDVYVLKLDSGGNFVWARSFAGGGLDEGRGIGLDGSGNVYTTGQFEGTADFDPGAGVFNLASAGQIDIFVSKLDSAGNFVWARAMGGTGAEDVANAMAIDAGGNVLISGSFNATSDFDPGAGTFNLTSAGLDDIFVARLDTGGNFVWARGMGGAGDDETFSLSLDSSGNVYTTGRFTGAVDFDPGAGTFNLTSAGSLDAFVSKLDSSGNYLWAQRMGGSGADFGSGIRVDSSGNVCTTGQFQGTVDFDPSTGTFNLTSNGGQDIFVSRLNQPATRTWDGGGATNNWLDAVNWVGDVAPNPGDNLVFGGGAGQLTNVNGFTPGTSFSSITFSATGYSVSGNSITIGSGITNSAGTNILNLNITLTTPLTINTTAGSLTVAGNVAIGGPKITINGAGNANLAGILSGAGGLDKNGTGILTFSGTSANTYTGTTTVNAGSLELNKAAGINAIAGNLVIGDNAGTDAVRLLANNQIADSATVTVASSGLLDLNGFSDTFSSLTLQSGTTSGASVATGTGTLTLNGNVDLNVTGTGATGATISGNLNLPAGTHNFSIADGAAAVDLNIAAVISGPGSIVKTGGAAGTLDASFGTSGKVITDFGLGGDEIRSAVILADGKILVAGLASNGTNGDFGLARYNPDGTLDTTFGIGGKVLTDFGASEEAQDLAVQVDGKIVVSGVSNNSGTREFALARYNADGSLDTGFGVGGKTLTGFGANAQGLGIAIQSDGKIVVAGGERGGINDFVLARYNTNGTLDAGFGVAGKVVTDFGGTSDQANDIAIQSDGKIVLVGISTSGGDRFAVARYNTNGSLDAGFGGGGLVVTATVQSAEAILLQPDGKIVAGGNAWAGSYNFALARYNTDGSLDGSFGGSGTVTTDFAGSSDSILALALQSDGKIVAGGYFFSAPTGTDFALARYNSDGSLDSTFDGDGKVTTSMAAGANYDYIFAVAMQPDGKIVAAGQAFNGTNTDFALARYHGADGTGTLRFSGSSANTYTGSTTVNVGTLELAKSPGVTAIAGDLIVGDNSGGANADVVRLLASNQIADTANVTVTSSGQLDLNGSSDAIGSLTLNSGTSSGANVTTGAGTLTLNGDATLTVAGTGAVGATVSGNVNLPIGTHTFNIADGAASSDLNISAVISGPGGLTKDGAGILELSGGSPNTYTGTTTVNTGVLALNKTAGTAAIAGNLVIGDNAGGTNADIVRLLASNQVPDTANVTVNSSGLLDLNNFSDTIGPLTLVGGNVGTGTGTLTLNGNVTSNAAPTTGTISGNLDLGGVTRTFTVADGSATVDLSISANISGAAGVGLTKDGAGTLQLAGTNTYPGTTAVNAGILRIDGSQPSSPITVSSGATVGGSGTMGTITATGATLSPGGPSPGIASTGNLALDTGSTIVVQLNGTTPGSGYDQLNLAGTVNLGGASLSVSLGFASSNGNTYTILSNDGADAVTGTFAGLAEGSSLTIGGRLFQISYAGGDGNDVVLTDIEPIPGAPPPPPPPAPPPVIILPEPEPELIQLVGLLSTIQISTTASANTAAEAAAGNSGSGGSSSSTNAVSDITGLLSISQRGASFAARGQAASLLSVDLATTVTTPFVAHLAALQRLEIPAASEEQGTAHVDLSFAAPLTLAPRNLTGKDLLSENQPAFDRSGVPVMQGREGRGQASQRDGVAPPRWPLVKLQPLQARAWALIATVLDSAKNTAPAPNGKDSNGFFERVQKWLFKPPPPTPPMDLPMEEEMNQGSLLPQTDEDFALLWSEVNDWLLEPESLAVLDPAILEASLDDFRADSWREDGWVSVVATALAVGVNPRRGEAVIPGGDRCLARPRRRDWTL